MTRADDAILEFLYNDGSPELVATPAVIEMNIEFGISTVRSRIRKLEKQDLVEYWDRERGAYQITQRGMEYLRGELVAEDLELDD